MKVHVCKQVELDDTLRAAVLDELNDKVHHHVRAVATQSLSGHVNVASISVKKYIDEMDSVLWNAVERLTQTLTERQGRGLNAHSEESVQFKDPDNSLFSVASCIVQIADAHLLYIYLWQTSQIATEDLQNWYRY